MQSHKAEPAATPKFCSRTELVVVPARSTDGSGKHISGLKKEDFVVKESAPPQKVAVFEEVKTRPASRLERAELQPGIFSNRVRKEAPQQRVIFALDTPLGDPITIGPNVRASLLHQLDPNVVASLPGGGTRTGRLQSA